jgi:creatinine amidohydrolase
MRRMLMLLAMTAVLAANVRGQQKLPVKWEELTADDFRKGIEQSKGTCVLPFGILEKHGPHLPLGTDLLNVRSAVLAATEKEYAIVFPEYYYGQISEAKHEPGTMAYSRPLQLSLLQETTDEMARNGCKKIVIVNGHGGNESLLPYFAQSQLDKPRDYVVYIQWGENRGAEHPLKKDKLDMHAGQSETSVTMVTHPDLVHMDRVSQESGADQKHDPLPETVYTGIWWYARFPDHYSGDGSIASEELGQDGFKSWVATISEAIQAVKADDASLKLQNEFFEKSKRPLDTKQ